MCIRDRQILYSDVSVIPMIAGIEYSKSSFPTFSVPSMCGLFSLDVYKRQVTYCPFAVESGRLVEQDQQSLL